MWIEVFSNCIALRLTLAACAHAATGAHTSTYAAAHGRRFIRQSHAALFGTHLHTFMVLGSNLCTFLVGFCCTHLFAILVALLLGHELSAINHVPCALLVLELVLIANTILILALLHRFVGIMQACAILICCKGNAVGKYHGTGYC